MGSSRGSERAGREFRLIEQALAPLAAGAPGAFALQDDAASTPEAPYVIAKDVLVAGVHFRKSDPLDAVAQKALRVNLSDLAAMGAKPLYYLLGCVWPAKTREEDFRLFAEGLSTDQKEFKVTLIGGDTTTHADKTAPLTISVTVLGQPPKQGVLRRNGATAGEDVYVTGVIGDGGLGLLAALKEERFARAEAHYLIERYRLPGPRVAFGGALAGVASAAIDVSDGLLADAAHLARCSGVAIDLHAARLPLSPAGARWVDNAGAAPEEALARLAGMGDDYELLFTVAPEKRRSVEIASQVTKTPIRKIGAVSKGEGVRLLDEDGAPIRAARAGYDHFAD